MALLTLFYEATSKSLAAARNLPLGYQLPALRQEDIVSLELSILKSISEFSQTPNELVNLTGYSARVSLGTAASVLASQNTFTIDATATKLTGLLNLNTAGVNALTDRQSGIYLELLFTEPGGGISGQRFPVFIEKAVFMSGTVVAPPSDVALGRLEAQRTYVAKEGAAGEAQIFTSADGLKKIIKYAHNDGSMREEPIS